MVGCRLTNHTLGERKRAMQENNRLLVFVMDVFSLTITPDDDTETLEKKIEFDILEEIAASHVENPQGRTRYRNIQRNHIQSQTRRLVVPQRLQIGCVILHAT